MSYFETIITTEEQQVVLEATRQTTLKLWVARQVVLQLRTILIRRIEQTRI
jgi:hypothetical protein